MHKSSIGIQGNDAKPLVAGSTVNFGKKYKIGDIIYSTTKRQSKPLKNLFRNGYFGFFEKGKRKYFCEVLKLVETRTGLPPSEFEFCRYWQFTYKLKVIKN